MWKKSEPRLSLLSLKKGLYYGQETNTDTKQKARLKRDPWAQVMSREGHQCCSSGGVWTKRLCQCAGPEHALCLETGQVVGVLPCSRKEALVTAVNCYQPWPLACMKLGSQGASRTEAGPLFRELREITHFASSSVSPWAGSQTALPTWFWARRNCQIL